MCCPSHDALRQASFLYQLTDCVRYLMPSGSTDFFINCVTGCFIIIGALESLARLLNTS